MAGAAEHLPDVCFPSCHRASAQSRAGIFILVAGPARLPQPLQYMGEPARRGEAQNQARACLRGCGWGWGSLSSVHLGPPAWEAPTALEPLCLSCLCFWKACGDHGPGPAPYLPLWSVTSLCAHCSQRGKPAQRWNVLEHTACWGRSPWSQLWGQVLWGCPGDILSTPPPTT